MKKIFLFPLLLMLAACQTTDGPKVLVAPEMIERPKIVLPPISPAQQSNVEWHVITKQNATDKIKTIEEKQGSVTLFALTAQGYQNLSMNVAELRRYIQQQNAVISAMKDYYEAPIKKEEKNGK
jgi:hypothetical protein